jgi:hypothetical protein
MRMHGLNEESIYSWTIANKANVQIFVVILKKLM